MVIHEFIILISSIFDDCFGFVLFLLKIDIIFVPLSVIEKPVGNKHQIFYEVEPN